MSNTNEEDKAECPVCGEEVLKRGMFMHIFQSDDPDGEGHYPRFEVPPDIDVDEIKVTDTEDVEIDYPDTQNIEDAYYLDTYTGKAYQGKRGLMVHLGQMAGQNNIPVNVTAKHDADDFPIVEIDDDGNITDVIREGSNDVPSIAPYAPEYEDEKEYIDREKVEEFVEQLKNSQTGAASAEAIEKALLEES